MSDIWYYAQADKVVGPLSLAHLKSALSLKSDARSVFVWHPTYSDWKKAEDVPELAAEVDPPASFPRRYRLSYIALGVLVMVAVIMGWRLLDPFKSFIEQLAAASPEAPMDVTWLFVVLLGAAYLVIAYYCRGGGYGGDGF
jgi:hypothetical protein